MDIPPVDRVEIGDRTFLVNDAELEIESYLNENGVPKSAVRVKTDDEVFEE